MWRGNDAHKVFKTSPTVIRDGSQLGTPDFGANLKIISRFGRDHVLGFGLMLEEELV